MKDDNDKKIKLIGLAAASVVVIVTGSIMFLMARSNIESKPLQVDDGLYKTEERGKKKEGKGVSGKVSDAKKKSKEDKAKREAEANQEKEDQEDVKVEDVSEKNSANNSEKDADTPDVEPYTPKKRKPQVAEPDSEKTGFKKSKDGTEYYEVKGKKTKSGEIKVETKGQVYLDKEKKVYYIVDDLSPKKIKEGLSNWSISTIDDAKELGYRLASE